MIFNIGGGKPAKVPKFTYSGSFELIEESEDNWRIKFLTGGKLKFTHLGNSRGNVELFLLGGGGGSGYHNKKYHGAGGGGGGRTLTTTVPIAYLFGLALYSSIDATSKIFSSNL